MMSDKWCNRVGVDENGLGAQLGPLAVTGVLARVDDKGERALRRRLPKAIRLVLGDSKQMVAHGDVRLGEAWARVLTGEKATSPADLFARLSLEGRADLTVDCSGAAATQCWFVAEERFEADTEQLLAVRRAVNALRERGVDVLCASVSTVCSYRLNRDKRAGGNRFVSDLHAMERIVLELRRRAEAEVLAVCGKVGGMNSYDKFFGPLSGYLHTTLQEGRPLSAYQFAGLGQVRFVRDADATDPLVMLASLVGKYVRELLMARIAEYHATQTAGLKRVSGYHDPLTKKFVSGTDAARRRLKIADDCFVRVGAAAT